MEFFARSARALVAATALSVALAAPLAAQEFTESHIKAARSALVALNATATFDNVLPVAAQTLKAELIQKDPNLQDLIVTTVDEVALSLVGRRADLEREAALVYARSFTEEELNQMAAFYSSPAGLKLLSEGPIVSRQVGEAADIWQRGLARDFTAEVAKRLQEARAAAAPATPATPAEGAAPAQ